MFLLYREKIKHCEKCGEMLFRHSKFNRFDEETGEPIYTVFATCPKVKTNWQAFWDQFLNTFSFKHHTKDRFITSVREKEIDQVMK